MSYQNSCKADKNTVARYIDLLEKTFVVFSVPSFSKNMRKEISKGKKYISTIVEFGMR